MMIARTKTFALSVRVVLSAVLLGLTVPAEHWLTPAPRGLALVAEASDGPDFVKGQVICEVSPGVNIYVLAARLGLTVLENLEDSLFLLGTPPLMSVQQAITRLEATPGVVLAEPNYWLESPEVKQRSVAWVDQRSVAWVDGESPSDYFDQSAMDLIRGEDAHDEADGHGTTVAVIDTGVDTSHPAFQHVAPGYDYVDNDRNPTETGGGPAYGHGTMVAGVVALLAPGATIMPIRRFSSDGRGAASNVGKGIRYAASHGADVITMSFGLSTASAPIQKAISFAWQQGAVLIAAAGNDDTSDPQYPASDELRVMAVAATDQHDIKADFSNYGFHIDVSAPGVSIYSAYPGGQFAWTDGTSFAAPFVSGLAALVWQAGSGDPVQVIQDTAVNIDAPNPGYGGMLGRGRIDALASVTP